MNQFEVNIYRGDHHERKIAMPVNVLRINPKLLPKDVIEALESQGLDVADMAGLEGVEGEIMDVAAGELRLVISIVPGTPVKETPPSVDIPESKREPEPEPKPEPKAEPEPPPSESAPEPEPAAPPPEPEPVPGPQTKKPTARTSHQALLTTENIANEIGWRTGHDLIYAAGAHLTLGLEIKSWSADDIDDEIRQVSKFYKPFYSTNLLEYLQYLMKQGKFCTVDGGKYALAPGSLKYLEERLSEEKMKKRRH